MWLRHSPDRSDQPFGKTVLPRRRRCSGLVPNAHSVQSARNDGAIDAIPIADEVARRVCVPKSSSVLFNRPNRLTSAENVCAVTLLPGPILIAIQVEEPT
jgi:hypothetical protein